MQLAKLGLSSGDVAPCLIEGQSVWPLNTNERFPTLAAILDAANIAETAMSLRTGESIPLAEARLRAPIDQQEVWAAGVTYKRSRTARMEESKDGGNFYDKVYDAPRPELFFKATPHRVVGPGEKVRIRRDAHWNVPEPELTLVLNSRKELIGYTIGNDMSSRDIEGENPLYLPQAKVYDGCCGLGPAILLKAHMPSLNDVKIELEVRRGGNTAFKGSIGADQIHRPFENLIDHLGRDNSFPNGVFLLTGTGVVPDTDFTLASGDQVAIRITGIGELQNVVA